jgi:hypothetical protein
MLIDRWCRRFGPERLQDLTVRGIVRNAPKSLETWRK